jgi:hypothetical protein
LYLQRRITKKMKRLEAMSLGELLKALGMIVWST